MLYLILNLDSQVKNRLKKEPESESMIRPNKRLANPNKALSIVRIPFHFYADLDSDFEPAFEDVKDMFSLIRRFFWKAD